MAYFRYVIVSTFLLFLTGCFDSHEADYYELGSVSGRIIDDVTKQPVKDVLVMATWKLFGGKHFGDSAGWTTFHVAETKTNKNGFFVIKTPRRIKRNLEGFDIRLAKNTPSIRYYKKGYFTATTGNNKSYPLKLKREFGWDGMTTIGVLTTNIYEEEALPLKKPASEKERLRRARIERESLQYLGCWVLRAPNFHAAIKEASEEESKDSWNCARGHIEY